ncbi:MAG: 50S ribosomal protein L16 [bacterium]|nr:50S ribosomal protein L16 [bacterium]
MGVHKRPSVFTRLKDRPYTRISYKVPSKCYVKGAPPVQTRQFVDGNASGQFEYEVALVAKRPCQVRDKCLETVRVLAKHYLEKTVSSSNYMLRIWPYPHHVLREHKTPTVATKAERISKGMRLAFGRPVGRAARVYDGQKVLSVFTTEKYLEEVKNVLRRIKAKLPSSWYIVVNKLSS